MSAQLPSKTYTAANGHTLEVQPHTFKDGSEAYVYAYAQHSDSCKCSDWDTDDWGDIL